MKIQNEENRTGSIPCGELPKSSHGYRFRKLLVVHTFIFVLFLNHFSQSISIEDSDAPFEVGFRTRLTSDTSRSFKFISRTRAVGRPIRLFIWYPARKSKPARFLVFADYVYSQSLEKEMRQLTSAEKSNFDKKLAETLEFFNVGAEQVKDLMKAETKASRNALEIKGNFPLVVLGNVGEGFYYSSLAEYLAANGYVVVTMPSVGANEGERCGFDLNCLKIQQTDMEFAIARMSKQPNVDASRIGLIAWSFSGLAAAHLQTRNPNVKAVVSLDAATGYQYGKEILDLSREYDVNKTNIPFLHLHGLAGQSRVAKNFDFFNTYQSKRKKLLEFRNLQHSDFISLFGIGVRYAKKENNEMTTSEIRQANLAIKEFLNAYLKKSPRKLKRKGV